MALVYGNDFYTPAMELHGLVTESFEWRGDGVLPFCRGTDFGSRKHVQRDAMV